MLTHTWLLTLRGEHRLQVFENRMLDRVLLEKIIVSQLVKKFPAFFGTQRFITMFTRACHWSLS
jgi:hypothetical protein